MNGSMQLLFLPWSKYLHVSCGEIHKRKFLQSGSTTTKEIKKKDKNNLQDDDSTLHDLHP